MRNEILFDDLMNNHELDKYRKNEDLQLHMELIDFYRDLFSDHLFFRSSVLVGSFAKGNPDRISDVDLIGFVDDGKGEEAFNLICKKEPFEVINTFQDKSGENIFYKKSIFDNFVSAEVYIIEKSSNFKLKRPYITLFDHDSFLPSIVEEGEAPKHEDFPTLSAGGEDLTWALLDLLKWSNRGQKDLVRMHLLKIAEKFKGG